VTRHKCRLISFRLEIVQILTQDWCPMILPDERLRWKLDLVHLEMVLTLTQDRCTVCAERTIGSKIVLDTPDRTPW
jgi:hypothetical protein